MAFKLPKGRPALMGILNVTPDSFSDGGLYVEVEQAVEAAVCMIEQGADLIDVGGESTRPGAPEVSLQEELRRVLAVVQKLVEVGIPVSIDTMKPLVAQEALAAGAVVLNDVTGFRDPLMIETAARAGCTICIMHMQGTPRTMQMNPAYSDVVAEVRDYLMRQAGACEAAGVQREKIWIDPGIGFGKTLEHNLSLLGSLEKMTDCPFPLLIGVSRKSFLGKILGKGDAPAPVSDRLEGTLAAQVIAQMKGASIIRAHDVLASRRAIEVTAAVMPAQAG